MTNDYSSFPAAASAVAVLVLWSMAHVESLYGGVYRPDGGGAVWMALAAVGAVLSRSPLAAFALVFPVQVLAELSRGELAFLAWRPMLAAFLPAFWTATLFLAAHSPRRFPPKEAWSGPPPPAEEASDSQGQP